MIQCKIRHIEVSATEKNEFALSYKYWVLLPWWINHVQGKLCLSACNGKRSPIASAISVSLIYILFTLVVFATQIL